MDARGTDLFQSFSEATCFTGELMTEVDGLIVAEFSLMVCIRTSGRLIDDFVKVRKQRGAAVIKLVEECVNASQSTDSISGHNNPMGRFRREFSSWRKGCSSAARPVLLCLRIFHYRHLLESSFSDLGRGKRSFNIREEHASLISGGRS